jgi:uncharacterized protein
MKTGANNPACVLSHAERDGAKGSAVCVDIAPMPDGAASCAPGFAPGRDSLRPGAAKVVSPPWNAIYILAFAVLWLTLVSGLAAAQPHFPALTGRIVDEAGLLGGADRQDLTRTLEAIEQKSTDQVVIYTARSLQGYDIADFGYQLGRAWQIGQKDKNNGVILIVAPNERKVRIEVGRGLEPQLTDALTQVIIQNAILPAFRRGDFPTGIKAGIRDIRDVLLGDAEAVKSRATRTQSRDAPAGEALMSMIIMGLFILFILWIAFRQSRYVSSQQQRQRYRRAGQGDRDHGGPIFIPGGWGGGSGGGSDGGGWGGGGGDFGGGGSSGSW